MIMPCSLLVMVAWVLVLETKMGTFRWVSVQLQVLALKTKLSSGCGCSALVYDE